MRGDGSQMQHESPARTMPAEAMQPVAEVVGAADQDEAPGEAQVPQAALQLALLALLHALRAVLQAILRAPHLRGKALHMQRRVRLGRSTPWRAPRRRGPERGA